MGDWCGSAIDQNQNKGSNGCEKGVKTRPCWCVCLSQGKKRPFSQGEVFFLLTRPLMGDLPSNHDMPKRMLQKDRPAAIFTPLRQNLTFVAEAATSAEQVAPTVRAGTMNLRQRLLPDRDGGESPPEL